MATTKGESISRIRKAVKGLKADALLTDRMIYSAILKYAKVFIKRADDANKLGKYNGLFQTLPGIELVEVSTIDAECVGINTCCTIKRTADPVPNILEGSFGPIIRGISSVDGSKDLFRTYPKTYVQMTNSTSFKFNKKQYYWWKNGYLFFPNLEWDVVDVDAMWEDAVSVYLCSADTCCVDRRSEPTNIPESLFADIEGAVKQDFINLQQIPRDNQVDNQSSLR